MSTESKKREFLKNPSAGNPDDYKYTKEHAWVKIDKADPTVITMGLSEHILDVVDTILEAFFMVGIGDTVGLTDQESVGVDGPSYSQLLFTYYPGSILDLNYPIKNDLETLRHNYTTWLLKMKVSSFENLDPLMTYDEYMAYIKDNKASVKSKEEATKQYNELTQEQFRYTKDHAWVRIQNRDEKTIAVGFSDYIIKRMGHVDEVDCSLHEGEAINLPSDELTVVTTENNSFILKSPFTGKLAQNNKILYSNPEYLRYNSRVWVNKITANSLDAFDTLMTYEQYQEYLKTLGSNPPEKTATVEQIAEDIGGEYRYTKTHEWVYVQSKERKIVVIGVTEQVIDEVGFIDSIEFTQVKGTMIVLPSPDLVSIASKDDSSEYQLTSPFAGTIARNNKELEKDPSTLYYDCDTWIIKIKADSLDGFNDLMTYDQYQEYIKTLKPSKPKERKYVEHHESTEPTDYRYTKNHERIFKEGGKTLRISMSNYVPKEIGSFDSIVIEKDSDVIDAREEIAVVKSTEGKTHSIVCPFDGVIKEANEKLGNKPELIRNNPTSWIARVTPDYLRDYYKFMTYEEYEEYLKTL